MESINNAKASLLLLQRKFLNAFLGSGLTKTVCPSTVNFTFINLFVHKCLMGMGGYSGKGFAYASNAFNFYIESEQSKRDFKKGYME